jgi:uncharacterized protein
VVGSGTLVTFPVLLAFGHPPVTANVSNTIRLVPGSLAGAWGYRGRLAGQRANMVRLGAASVLGGVVGAVLLLSLPASTFDAIVPAFIAVVLVLTVFQARLRARLQRRAGPSRRGCVIAPLAVFGSGVYGGYFGAGQGMFLLGILGRLHTPGASLVVPPLLAQGARSTTKSAAATSAAVFRPCTTPTVTSPISDPRFNICLRCLGPEPH